jgi:REP element-mobilizing transposase RayT
MNEQPKPRVAADTQSRSQTGAPRRRQVSTPPYNPGLQKLVDGKQAWAVPLSEDAKAKGFLGWHQRGYLPHYDAPWITQIVTLRLVDSLPASRRGEWEHLLRIEDNGVALAAGAPACSRLIRAENTQSRSQTGAPTASDRRRRLEDYLDRGLGECWLRQPALAQLAEGALCFFDGQRYQLGAWVIMPNHVHLLVDVWETPLAELVKSWKSFVAREANKLLGRSGTFWEREYLDTVIADEAHRRTAVRYIENNPVKAGLAREAKEWAWSSARFRDDYGVLKHSRTESRSQTGAPANGAPTCSRLEP